LQFFTEDIIVPVPVEGSAGLEHLPRTANERSKCPLAGPCF
jgi:hypothetical protein